MQSVVTHQRLLSAVVGATHRVKRRVKSVARARTQICLANFQSQGPNSMPPIVHTEPFVVPPRSVHSATVFLLHGLGDTYRGWAPIAGQEFWGKNLPHVKFILPTAPIRPVSMNGGMPQTAWFDIQDLREEHNTLDEQGVQESFTYMTGLVEKEIQSGIASECIVVAGYSQGGAVALSMLRSPHKFAAVLGMSSFLPVLSDMPPVSEANRKTPLLLCHGINDPTVRYVYGVKAHEILKKEMESVEMKQYMMGHELCQEELLYTQRFLESVLPKTMP